MSAWERHLICERAGKGREVNSSCDDGRAAATSLRDSIYNTSLILDIVFVPRRYDYLRYGGP